MHVLKGKRDKGTFSPGGRFSLGRMGIGSGYCVGIVVESRLGIRQAPQGDENGLEDVWILGEPFFGDCQVAFDVRSPLFVKLGAILTAFVVEGEEGRHPENMKGACFSSLI